MFFAVRLVGWRQAAAKVTLALEGDSTMSDIQITIVEHIPQKVDIAFQRPDRLALEFKVRARVIRDVKNRGAVDQKKGHFPVFTFTNRATSSVAINKAPASPRNVK